jgi:hypothetical protein
MGFTLTPKQGAEMSINRWNWLPIIELLREHTVIDSEKLKQMRYNHGTEVSGDEALMIAGFLNEFLKKLGPQDRLLMDLTITSEPDSFEFHRADPAKNYSATTSSLAEFRDFCQTCQGFIVW